MRINVMRKMGYEGTQIYIMHFADTFQYLFAWKNDIYQNTFVFKPLPVRRILHLLRVFPSAYTLDQLEGIEHEMLSVAMRSIDKLKKMKDKRQKVAKSDSKCSWRMRMKEDGKTPVYECIYHDIFVPFKEGVIPSHKLKKGNGQSTNSI